MGHPSQGGSAPLQAAFRMMGFTAFCYAEAFRLIGTRDSLSGHKIDACILEDVRKAFPLIWTRMFAFRNVPRGPRCDAGQYVVK